MAITFSRDGFSHITPPALTLCKASGERIGTIRTLEYSLTRNLSEPDALSFSTPLYIDSEINPVYDDISNMKYIELGNGEGRFCIMSVQIESEGTQRETKTVEAKSLEILLGQIYECCIFNTGEDESIDGVQFYNTSDTSHSLMHLVLAKATGWSVGQIEGGLSSMRRSFNQERIAVYDFLMNDVSEAFDVYFEFVSATKTIKIHKMDSYGGNTDIHVSYNNLLKSTSMQCDTDNIKTCITLTGQDDLTIREINLGSSELYNFDAYASTEYWSSDLVTDYNKWKALYARELPNYENLLRQYNDKTDEILYEQTTRFPAEDKWESWVTYAQYGNLDFDSAKALMVQYSYDSLEEKKKAYEKKQTVMQKSGWGTKDTSAGSNWRKNYYPVHTVIKWIKQVLDVDSADYTSKKTTIRNLKNQRARILADMTDIMNEVSMPNNFSSAQLEELAMFIREDELSSDNYLVTDTMTNAERRAMLNDMLEFGRKELQRVSTPQLTFNASLLNLFAIPEFDDYSGEFDVGNYIWVTLRDNYNIKAKLLSVHYDFKDPTQFSCTFGNIVRKEKNIFTDIQDAMNAATSAATSVSFNQSYWSQGSQAATDIDRALAEGLTRAGYVLTDGTGTDAVWDERGLFLNTQATKADGSAEPHPNDSIFLGGGRILFTQDSWESVETALGRIALYTHNDSTGANAITTDGTFGLLAKQVVAGTVWGSNIIGGTIKSSNFKQSNPDVIYATNGTLIDLTNSVFKTNQFAIDVNGTAYFRGSGSSIQEGTIGQVQIANGAIIASKIAESAVTSSKISANAVTTTKITAGAITTTLIANGAVSTTKIAGGAITAEKISVNAVTADKITANAITADKISVNAVTARSISANAVIASKISANAVTADKITANAVNADKIRANAITADKISANAVTARSISANAVTAGKISANAVTASKISANAVTADKITANAVNADKIAANAITARNISAGAITAAKISTDAIKSTNYSTPTSSTDGYARRGTFLDLADGSITSKNFKIDSSGNAEFKGDIRASDIQGSSFLTEDSNSSVRISAGQLKVLNDDDHFLEVQDEDDRRYFIHLGGHHFAVRNSTTYLGGDQDLRTFYIGVAALNAASSDSDERVKRDINTIDIDFSRKLINKIRPVSFRYIKGYGSKDDDNLRYGVIAQQIRETLDELGVVDKVALESQGWEEYRTVEYQDFIAHLINTIQDLYSQIDEMKSEIQSLHEEINQMKGGAMSG